MRVTILGTRGNIESSAAGYSKHSGVLVDGSILLDVGETEYLRHRPKFVFITHLTRTTPRLRRRTCRTELRSMRRRAHGVFR